MRKMMKRVRPARSKAYLQQKLVSAGAMLLVSAILMVSTSYAWYVLSTAPEVSNIKTQVGANGALEVALLDENSWNDLTLLDMGDIDESLGDQSQVAATVANLTWGNLVDLDDASYGMDKIILQPSRLFIDPYGDGYQISSVPLKVPVYGEDGRVKSLDKTSAVAFTYANGGFSNANGYGVRAIGTAASMSVFQLGMNAARSNLVTYAAAARTLASNTLQSTGDDLANIVVAYAVSDKDNFANTDVQNIQLLASGLNDALDEIEIALRYVFAGYITTSGAYYMGTDDAGAAAQVAITAENYQAKLAEITDMSDTGKTLATLRTEYPGITAVVPAIDTYLDNLSANQTKVDTAMDTCQTMIDTGNNDYTWSELANIIYPLVDTNAMLVNGKTITALKNELIVDGSINYDKAFALISGGITITVPSGSGILSDVADFADDYTAVVPVTVNATVGGNAINTSMDVLMTTATTKNPVYLTACSNNLKAATVADAAGSNSITDYYGYAIDLAFRTNAEDSSLQLQTEPENRIYEGTSQNAALQGGGSYMSFTTSAGLSATKMVKLMSGIRVVFAEPKSDGTMEVLAIAALDCTLGKDVYVQELDKDGNATGYYYLDGSAAAYQNSDLITAEVYATLPETSAVTFNKTTGKVTAKLYINNFELVKRYLYDEEGEAILDDNDDPTFAYTGALKLNGKANEATITDLLSDVVQKVTALVYLDGSVVNNSTVAANSAQSMAGTLNLQFSSSATLIPAENTKLQSQTGEVDCTEMTSDIYKAGYLYYSNTLCKITDGCKLYTDDRDNVYFTTSADESAYTLLSADNVSSVLTAVTLSATPESVTLAVNGTAVDVTATLANCSVTAVEYSLVRTDSGSDEIMTYGAVTATDGNTGTITLTGALAGTGTWRVVAKITIAGTVYTIQSSNTIAVTVQ